MYTPVQRRPSPRRDRQALRGPPPPMHRLVSRHRSRTDLHNAPSWTSRHARHPPTHQRGWADDRRGAIEGKAGRRGRPGPPARRPRIGQHRAGRRVRQRRAARTARRAHGRVRPPAHPLGQTLATSAGSLVLRSRHARRAGPAGPRHRGLLGRPPLPPPHVIAIPINDLPPSETALVWLTASRSPKVNAFAARHTMYSSASARIARSRSPLTKHRIEAQKPRRPTHSGDVRGAGTDHRRVGRRRAGASRAL